MPLSDGDSDSDRIRLQHMLDAADQAITVLGEAASRLSPSARSALPAVPWSSIVAMRNRLVHAYFDIDADVLWTSVTESLPPLRDGLREFLEGHPDPL